MKLPLLSGRQVAAALTRLGFIEVHRKGSHLKMKHEDGNVIVFPLHDKVDRYTLKGALRDAEIEIEDILYMVKLFYLGMVYLRPPRRRVPVRLQG